MWEWNRHGNGRLGTSPFFSGKRIYVRSVLVPIVVRLGAPFVASDRSVRSDARPCS